MVVPAAGAASGAAAAAAAWLLPASFDSSPMFVNFKLPAITAALGVMERLASSLHGGTQRNWVTAERQECLHGLQGAT